DLAVQPIDFAPILAGKNLVYERRFITVNSEVFRAEANIRQLPDGRIATVVRELKDRERNTQRVKLSEERFRRVVESNMIGVYFWNMDGEITDANDRFLRQFGYSRQSLARGDLNWKRMTPDEWRRIDNINMKLIRRDGQIEPYEKQLFHSEGHELPVLVGAALYEGANEGVAFVLELSEMKATERALHESQVSLSTLIDNLPGVVFRAQIAPDWPMTYVSDSIKDLSGYSADEFINRRRFLADIIHPDDARDVWEARQKANDEQRQFQISYRVVHKNHDEKWVWEQTRPVFNDDGKIVALEGFIADNSERRLLEEQLQQAQKLESVGRLAGGVAHDFNNLLTAVLGYSDFALMYTQDSKLKEFLLNIRSAAERGATLTRQLLGFARKQIVEPQTFSPNTRINDIRKLLYRLIGENIELVLELNPESGMVRVDPSQFEQVLVNLIVNARDAMPEGGLLKIRSAPVDLGDDFVHDHPEVKKGKYVRVDIEDTGHGIDAETIEKIFEPFFTTKAKGKGTGLGLATCYGIIKQNHGHIEVSSAPGHGALFTVYLPRIETPDNISLMADKQPAAGNDFGTVLLVEDEPVVRQLCLGALMGQGYHVLTASNGEEALRLVKEDRARFDLLVTDVVMPRLSGTQLAEKLRRILPDLRVLFVSGYAGDEVVQTELLNGVEFLKKPFSPAQLTQRVREVLERKVEDSK
ncbi:MAG: PAS domain S-box protein, partial [Planctomycetota bacterium]